MFMRSGIALFPFGLSRCFPLLYIYLPNTLTPTFSGDNDYYVQKTDLRLTAFDQGLNVERTRNTLTASFPAFVLPLPATTTLLIKSRMSSKVDLDFGAR